MALNSFGKPENKRQKRKKKKQKKIPPNIIKTKFERAVYHRHFLTAPLFHLNSSSRAHSRQFWPLPLPVVQLSLIPIFAKITFVLEK